MSRKACRDSQCPLVESIEVPYAGNLKARIAFCGEAPGFEEEKEGKPFFGSSGKMARGCCLESKVNWRAFFVLNSARCRIDKKEMSGKEITKILNNCRPFVQKAMHRLKPKAIICAGDFALRQILRVSGITKARGKWVWSSEFNCWVLPVFHPAYILRNMALRPLLVNDLKMVKEFIKNGFKPPQESSDTEYREVQSIRHLLDQGRKSKHKLLVSLDTEGQGLDWIHQDYIAISYSVSVEEGKAFDVILYNETKKKEEADITITWPRVPADGGKPVDTEVYVKKAKNFSRKLDEVEALLKSKKFKKVMMNGNFDVHVLNTLFMRERGYHPEINCYTMDIQAAAHVLDENIYRTASLYDLQRGFTDMQEDYNSDFAMKYGKSDMLSVPNSERTPYACKDADATRRVAVAIREELLQKGNEKLLNYVIKFVQPALQSLALLEQNGCYINRKELPRVKEIVRKLMMLAQRKCLKAAPKAVLKWKIHRTKNKLKKKKDGIYLTRRELVRDLLFDKAGFSLKATKFTKGREPSTDKHVVKALLDGRLPKKAAVFLKSFQKFVEYHTLYSRYLSGFEKHVRDDARIHPSISLTTAVTGRVAMSKPNLMNNPKRSTSAKQVRKLIAAPPRWLLVEVDESQSELRWAAHNSRDKNMIKVFREGKVDIHTATAISMLDVTHKQWLAKGEHDRWTARRDAKSINFGLLFGMSIYGFIKYAKEEYEMEVTWKQAEAWVNIFFRRYPGLKSYHKQSVIDCKRNGYAESPLGRRRRLPEIYSQDDYLRGEAERMAINQPIQSPSSDTVIIAYNEMRRKEIFHPDYFKPNNFIHDSLIFEIKDCSRVEDYVKTAIHEMEHPPLERDFGVKLLVPLKAEAEIGKNLAEMEEMKL